LLVGIIVVVRTGYALKSFDTQKSNFTTYWIAGRMLVHGENPYDESQFLSANESNGITWHPNKIFHYPLPLAVFCIPLGLFPLSTAYALLTIVTQLIVAFAVYVLVGAQVRAGLVIFILLNFFGPLYLTIHVGTLGALALLFLALAILALEHKRDLLAG